MPDEGRFRIRGYQPGDEEAILDLFARSFPHAPRSRAHFDWKFRANPFGNGRISLAFETERLVGHYAGYSVPFRAGGHDVDAHQIGDTMTDPAVRHVGRGPTSVLGRTALDFYARFCEGRVAFNFGFNVANIQRFSMRFLRSERVGPVGWRVRDLVAHPWRPPSRAERWLQGWRLELVRATGPEWNALFERVSRAYGFLVRRDAAWVRWRYLEAPENPAFVVAVHKWGHLVGWIAFRIRGRSLLWGDALFDPEFPEAVELTLRHVVPSYPVDRVEAWFPPRPRWFDAILRDLRFESLPEPQDLSVMCVPFTWEGAAAAMREELYYTWGDSDLF